MRCVIETLTFALLDDIGLGIQSEAITFADLPPTRADNLGPLIELRHAGLLNGHGPWLDIGRHAELLSGLGNGGKWFHASGNQGFVAVTAAETEPVNWTEFEMRAKRAATQAGFAGDHAGQLVAAMGELRSNICEHSERKDTGYIVYDATPRRFEFVAADAGIGVLQSLRTHPSYASVSDAGSALELALTEGVSRRFDEAGHGNGFRPIFVGLANASEHLRFRSEDHSREVVKQQGGGLQAMTRQRSRLPGFLCSVLCSSGT